MCRFPELSGLKPPKTRNLNQMIMDKEEIKTFLPHREPMLLIEEATIDEQGVAYSKYRIKDNEFFTQGHFPGNPIVPGVILCEIMAQSCAVIVKDEIPGHMTLYAGLDNVRFKNAVHPGDLCEVTARLDSRRGLLFFCSATLKVDGKLCCKGQLAFALVPIQ